MALPSIQLGPATSATRSAVGRRTPLAAVGARPKSYAASAVTSNSGADSASARLSVGRKTADNIGMDSPQGWRAAGAVKPVSPGPGDPGAGPNSTLCGRALKLVTALSKPRTA